MEGPSSPHSHSSSAILEEYDEIDGLAAFAGIFVNLVSCNFTDLASNILIDDEDDYQLPIWAGTVPVHTVFGTVEPDARLLDGVTQPSHINTLKDRLG